jgi:DNA mismatch endonuclease (patch repair protein)
MDRLTREQRSYNMSRIRASGTKFEKQIFKELTKRGIYFQRNYSKIIGKPDIARPRARKVVFLHSDFWHGWQLPRWDNILPNDFWKQKLRKNRARDRLVKNTLRRTGWNVMVLWEHSFRRDPRGSIKKLVKFLE